MAKPMTRTQLVAALAEQMGSDKKTASRALDGLISVITDEVAKGGAVTIPGIGKIYTRERPARMVRNPATGEAIRKSVDAVVKITIARALKEAVSAGGDPDDGTDDPGPMIRRGR